MLDEDNYQVIGRRYGKCYKLGDPVTIRVKGVDMMKKLIDFEMVDETYESPRDKARGSSRNPKSTRSSSSGRKKGSSERSKPKASKSAKGTAKRTRTKRKES